MLEFISIILFRNMKTKSNKAKALKPVFRAAHRDAYAHDTTCQSCSIDRRVSHVHAYAAQTHRCTDELLQKYLAACWPGGAAAIWRLATNAGFGLQDMSVAGWFSQ